MKVNTVGQEGLEEKLWEMISICTAYTIFIMLTYLTVLEYSTFKDIIVGVQLRKL